MFFNKSLEGGDKICLALNQDLVGVEVGVGGGVGYLEDLVEAGAGAGG